MKKNVLRLEYKNKRLALNEEMIHIASEQIVEKLTDFILSNGFQHVHTYLSSDKHKEVHTKDFVRIMWHNSINLYTSISNVNDYSMTHYPLNEHTELKENQWGILEPLGEEPIDEKQFEVVVTPLLVFDKNGNRVGYGKGYYDRFFSKCHPEVIKIGLSLFDPIEEIEDLDEYDFPLDFAITPHQFYAF